MFIGLDAKPGELCASCTNAVCLFDASGGNTSNSSWRRSKWRHRCERLGSIRDGAHVYIHTLQGFCPGDFDKVVTLSDVTSHLFQHIEKCNISLFGITRNVFDPNGPTTDGRRGEEVGSGGGIGLNGVIRNWYIRGGMNGES